jgi:hypothetical protein
MLNWLQIRTHVNPIGNFLSKSSYQFNFGI